MVDLVKLNTNDTDSINYIINSLIGNTMVVTKELLNSSNVPYIVSIRISSDDYIIEANNLTQEQIDNIMFPEVLSPIQQ